MTWSMSWGPIHKDTSDGNSVPSEGSVMRGSTGGLRPASHPVSYDATDSRHGHENNIGGTWPSIDHMSGPVTDSDWDHSKGHFPDGPGPWRQT